MTTPALSLETTLEWWDEEKLPALRAAVAACPADPKAQAALEQGERYRERAYTRAAEAWAREQDAEYASQWSSWAFGPE